MVTMTRCALLLDFTQIHVDGRPLSQIEKEFTQILRAILACQEVSDWQGIADRIEYELLTNLVSWKNSLNKLRLSQISNA